MSKMTDLEEFQNNVESFLKNEEFNIFRYQDANFSEFISDLKWYDSENWEEFFAIAKKEGITTIFEEIEQFSKNEFESFKENLEEDTDDFQDSIENICANLESNLDEINSVSFSWINNNVRHTITKQVAWLGEIEQEIKELKRKQLLQQKKLEHEQQEQRRPSYEEMQQEDVPKELLNKDPNDLAKQLLDYIEVEHPDADRSELYHIEKAFWQEKGLNNYSIKHRIFSQKISSIIEKINDKKEKDQLPELVEKCVEWAMENKIYKPTQSVLRGHLAEDDIDLSTNNFKILHTRVCLELKS